MLIDREEVISEAKSAAHTTLQQAEQFMPYQEGVATKTVTAAQNPLLPAYQLEVRLRYTDLDSRAQAGTVAMTEQPPKQSHWTNLFVRRSHTFLYAEASGPDGNRQTVFEVKRGKQTIFKHTQFSDSHTTEGRLGFFAIHALRRMTPAMTSLTEKMLMDYPHDQPTQPL